MKSYLLAVVLFAVCFLLAVPTAQAHGGMRFRSSRVVVRQPLFRQQVIVRQQFHSAPIIVPFHAPQAFIVPQQHFFFQQPQTIIVPQAFSTHSFFAY